MSLWSSDEELFALVRHELFTAVVGDVMDKLGFIHQFLPLGIKPIDPQMVVIGRAMPVLEADIFGPSLSTSANPLMSKPFGLMLRALDDLKTNEVYICTGASRHFALWGEMMSTRAMKLGAAGVVLDGCYRDTSAILDLNFPTFGIAGYAQDQGVRGKVIDFRIQIEIGEVTITPGDIIFGDRDGVCVIPKAAVQDTFMAAVEKARGEKLVKKALESGMSATEAWDQFGIL